MVVSLRKIGIYFLILAVLMAFNTPQIAHAAALSGISDTLTRIKKSQTANHTLSFTTPTGIANTDTVTLTFAAEFNIASVVGGDVTIEGAAVTSATVLGQVLTITAGAGNVVAAAGTADIVISNNHITNPAAAGTYVVSIAGSFGDTGSFAIVILDDDQVVVGATIDPYLTFTLTTNSVTLTKSGGGNPSWTSTGYNQGAANTLLAATNGATGYTITYNGATLTAGGRTIDAMAAKAVSSTGAEQFGINLKDNATPNTGTEPSGSGSGAPTADYNTADQYKFVASTTTDLASAAAATASNTFTVSYIANVAAVTEAAAYSTTITYICTGHF